MAWNDENLTPSVTQETDAALVSLGQRGCACVFDGGAVPAGNYAAVQCLTDCVFVTLDTTEGTGLASPFFPLVDNGATVPAGTILYGPFVAAEVASGGIIVAYKA
jgi:hypothetical protein